MNQTFDKKIVAIVVLIVVAGASYSLGTRSRTVVSADAPRVEALLVTDKEFAPFWKVWGLLDEKFVGTATTTKEERIHGAMKGLVESMGDPYTVFFPPEEAKLFESDISGTFSGVGMEIGIKDSVLTVIAPLKGSPAEKAGMKTGDKVLKIGTEETKGMSVEKAVKLIRGPVNTKVVLTVIPTGTTQVLERTLTRETIEVPSIETEVKTATGATAPSGAGLRDDGIFVIRLFSFTSTSPNQFRSALREFVKSGSHKLILDLRGNPGGYLEAAVDMASWFLPIGKVIVSEDFGNNAEPKVYRSKGYDAFNTNMKMVILVNQGSASASEILAGALKEHGVAQLVGEKTFGKGSVQELVKITPDTSLKVTIARWLTPNGTNLSKNGLVPDVEVKITEKDIKEKKDPQLDKAVEILKALP